MPSPSDGIPGRGFVSRTQIGMAKSSRRFSSRLRTFAAGVIKYGQSRQRSEKKASMKKIKLSDRNMIPIDPAHPEAMSRAGQEGRDG